MSSDECGCSSRFDRCVAETREADRVPRWPSENSRGERVFAVTFGHELKNASHRISSNKGGAFFRCLCGCGLLGAAQTCLSGCSASMPGADVERRGQSARRKPDSQHRWREQTFPGLRSGAESADVTCCRQHMPLRSASRDRERRG